MIEEELKVFLNQSELEQFKRRYNPINSDRNEWHTEQVQSFLLLISTKNHERYCEIINTVMVEFPRLLGYGN